MKNVWIVLVIVLMAGCNRKMLQSTTSSQADTTSNTINTVFIETEKIDTVKTPADSSWLKALLKCDSNNNAYIAQIIGLKNGRKITAPSVSVNKAGELTVNCNIDSGAIYNILKEKYFGSDTSNYKGTATAITITKQPIIQKKQLTWWQKTQLNFGRLCFFLILIYCVYRILKTYTKVQMPALNIFKIFKSK